MHPSSRIRFAKSNILEGKRIALAVTGSIAAVESVKIARELIRHGAEVVPYATRAALKFVGRDALLFATGNEVIDELTGMDEHLYDFDLVLVSPATADIIAKAACGIADNAVSTLILANLRKTLFVPAMSSRMYENPVFRENLEKVKKFSRVLEPKLEEGEMKLPDRERIAAEVMHTLSEKLRGRRILVVGGAGYEYLDDFRIVSNLSSGRTAVEIAKHAYYLGAEVYLMHGLMTFQVPGWIEKEDFSTVESLISRIPWIVESNFHAVIVPAALPDYRPTKLRGKANLDEISGMNWVENPKFLRALREKYDGFLVGFKAEYGVSEEELLRKARARMDEYSLDIVVANDLRDVGKDATRALIISRDGVTKFEGTKGELALKILEMVADAI